MLVVDEASTPACYKTRPQAQAAGLGIRQCMRSDRAQTTRRPNVVSFDVQHALDNCGVMIGGVWHTCLATTPDKLAGAAANERDGRAELAISERAPGVSRVSAARPEAGR